MDPREQININKVRTLTRFHFIAGLPGAGATVLSALLQQNPRFVAPGASIACEMFRKMGEMLSADDVSALNLDEAQKIALWRSVFDAIYHDRPIDSVVFDSNRAWLNHTDQLVQLFPLSRFILCVRNPAAIANSLEVTGQIQTLVPGQSSQKDRLKALMAGDGYVGASINLLRRALSGQQTERMIVIDYDRLVDDPEEVMDVLYDFLREPAYFHDYKNLLLTVPRPGSDGAMPPKVIQGAVQRRTQKMVLAPRTIQQLSGRAFWRNLRRTNATMMLGRA